MRRPDFARTDLSRIDNADLRFIIENFPLPVRDFQEISSLINNLPNTLESMLGSDYLFDSVCDRERLLLGVSPFLLFNVLLRRSLRDHSHKGDRKIVNYLANLLALFVHSDRMHRVERDDAQGQQYIIDLIKESETVDTDRRFLIFAHIGNYALFVTGLFPQWIEYRYRYKRRPVDLQYFIDFGRAYFHRASGHPRARELGLEDVFLQLSTVFDGYRVVLNHMSSKYLSPPPQSLSAQLV